MPGQLDGNREIVIDMSTGYVLTLFNIFVYTNAELNNGYGGPAAAMKPYDTYGIRKWEFLDIVWEVEVKVKLPSVVSGYFIQSELEKNNYEVSKGNTCTLLLMNIN